MQTPTPPPDPISQTLSLISSAKTLPQTKSAHARAVLLGLRHSLTVTAALILSYSSSTSQTLFTLSPPHLRRSAFLWNTLVRARANSRAHADAFRAYNNMVRAGVRPDDRTFPFLLKACADSEAATRKGREAHASALKLGFTGDVFVSNTLLSFYGAAGGLRDSWRMFDEMRERDVVSWNSIISVFSDNGFLRESLESFLGLMRSGLAVNSVSLVSILRVCAAGDYGFFGRGVHRLALKVGLDSHVWVGNGLIDMYGKCGDLGSSVRVFRCMSEKSDVSWNSIMGAYVNAGCYSDCLSVLQGMLEADVEPNSITVSTLLPTLVELNLFNAGKEVHAHSIRRGATCDVFVNNSLIDLYGKSGRLDKASSVFAQMGSRNVVSWNAMIGNFAQNGAELKAMGLVKEMQSHGERPNSITFTNVLPACARVSSIKQGMQVHARSLRDGSCFDQLVSNALIDMYAKCGRLDLARHAFDVSERDQVSYNAIITAYAHSQHCSEALHLFSEMGLAGIVYDNISLVGALSACANLPAIKQGKEIHCACVRKLRNTHLFVANSILDMYIKCGRIDLARRVFDRMPVKDVASHNAMILGYGMRGELDAAIELFDAMEGGVVECDHVSYTAVLCACSHGGLIEEGKKYFARMVSEGVVAPTQTHYACMVDLLGRAGLVGEASELVRGMPFEADWNVWGALVGACRVHGEVEVGRWAAERLLELRPGHGGYYVLTSNMLRRVGDIV
ncbi:Pentatricopeptide repeat-containing protein [Acorus calamus]|uniref:Pentatricopeptide repeat-containing protein n=1 Tax=Acorus calamus TaxID=4465 RepID=A0AAV9EYX7_ACOCL|nr:Pentatricopeptide repeat-containing protein [Acorus calamus]